jgi:hypothetical protein
MAIKTVVTWGETLRDQEKIKLEISKQISAGATDGSVENDHGGISVRRWTTVEAAQGWINFLNGLDQPPISAIIKQD